MTTSALRPPPSALSGAAQAALDLGIERGAAPDLREAYDKTRLAHEGITFDRALKEKHFRICLEHIAQALATMRVEGEAQ